MYGHAVRVDGRIPAEGVSLFGFDDPWVTKVRARLYGEMDVILEEMTDPVKASYVLFFILTLEEALDIAPRGRWRRRVARTIRRLRLYIRDAGEIGDQCRRANLHDMAWDYHVAWDNWDTSAPGDWEIGCDVRDGLIMPLVDFVRSSRTSQPISQSPGGNVSQSSHSTW